MSPLKPRGLRVVYVAASAADLPSEVQDWLGQAQNRATASPHIHDLLASLATGSRPSAVIVNMCEVDWSEMDFFDYVHRLSPQTTLYVTGFHHEEDKLQAACRRGGLRFDASQLAEECQRPLQSPHTGGPSDLLAGEVKSESPGDQTGTRPEPVISPEPPLRVRLVQPSDSEGEADEAPVPFPWSPSRSRPQRTPPPKYPPPATGVQTPPPRRPPASTDTESASSQPAAEDETPPPEQPRRSSIELTAEELAALIGKPIEINHDQAREKRQ